MEIGPFTPPPAARRERTGPGDCIDGRVPDGLEPPSSSHAHLMRRSLRSGIAIGCRPILPKGNCEDYRQFSCGVGCCGGCCGLCGMERDGRGRPGQRPGRSRHVSRAWRLGGIRHVPPQAVPAPNYLHAHSFVGYPEYLAQRLRERVSNASCPGETSASLLYAGAQSNGCENSVGSTIGYRTYYPLHVQYQGTQMQYALKYLTAHKHTRLITLDIGANDAFVCQETTADLCSSTSELAQLALEIGTNLTHHHRRASRHGLPRTNRRTHLLLARATPMPPRWPPRSSSTPSSQMQRYWRGERSPTASPPSRRRPPHTAAIPARPDC